MDIDPEWVGAVVALMTASGGVGAWIHREMTQRRAALPILRADWRQGAEGPICHLRIINRLDEDLKIEAVECKGVFVVKSNERYDPSRGVALYDSVGVHSPMRVGWLVPPRSEVDRELELSPRHAPRWLRLTISSSSRTLRSKRVIVADSQKP